MSALGNLLMAVDQAPAAEGLWVWLQHEAPRLFTQLDGFLLDLTRAFGAWTYVVLFAIVVVLLPVLVVAAILSSLS